MPEYLYKARNSKGKIVNGVMAAANPEDLYSRLTGIGCYPTDFKTRKRSSFSLRKKVKRRDLLTFTVHLATILSSGVPILTGLQDLLEQTEEGYFRNVIEDLHRNIEAGTSLSQSLREHPEVFSELYTSMVTAGESTGKLDGTLRDLTNHLEWQEELIGNIKQATLYPLMVFWAVAGLIALIFTVVLPKFLVIFEKSNIALPLPTRIVVGISNFMVNHWMLLLFGLSAVYMMIRVMKRIPRGRYYYDRMKLAIPVFGPLQKKIILSRFAHTFSHLYSSGVNIIQALELIEKTGDNLVFEMAIRDVKLRVKEGKKLAEMMKETGVFPPIFIRMVSIGEETGKLELSLEKLSGFFDREVPLTIKKVFGILEPVIIAILGIVVGTVAMSIFLPLYQMMSVTGG